MEGAFRFQMRRSLLALLAMLAVVAAGAPASVNATPGDVGYRGQHFAGTGTEVTGAKPESKLWWNDGSWWAVMWDEVSGDNHIFKLNRETHAWIDTGVPVDTRSGTRADALWDGTKLYVASHGYTTSAASGFTARLYRFSYDAGADTYALDSGFPVSINNYKTETLVIDKDSTGRLWATWVQDATVYVNATTGDDRTWGVPFALPVPEAAGLTTDDISSLVAFGGKIGVMWSNQNTPAMYFSVHVDGDPVGSWQPAETARGGPLSADDHINLKRDRSGRVFAATKTNEPGSGAPVVELLVRDPASGTWTNHVFGRHAERHTRPIVVLDEANGVVHMFATSGDAGGTIYEKTSPTSSISFESGLGTPFIHDAASADMNDATSTKQNVNGATGLVVMASNDTTGYYWHNEQSLGAPALAADFGAAPLSGSAPLTVSFTDTSTGAPTSWSWDFGDGTSSTAQNPTHTYSTPGNYTVSLTVSNAGGSDTRTRAGFITVLQPTPLRFTPVADAFVSKQAPTANFGGAATLRVKNGGTAATAPHFRSYLKFDVTGLTEAKVSEAKLRLYVVDPGFTGGRVLEAPHDWAESTITWNNAPAPSATGLATIGSTATANAWIEVTLPAASFSRNGTYTLEIRSDTPHDGYTWYSSREGANAPELVLTIAEAPPPPVAGFSGSPTEGSAPVAVSFTDTSTGEPTSWSWDFGDGTSSTAQNPTHTYSTPGSYTVSLTVSNAGGSDTRTRAGYITVLQPTPLRFTPVADAFVSKQAPTANFGGAATLRVKNGGTAATAPHFRSYVKFEVNGLTGATVSEAKLRLYVVDPGSTGGRVFDASNEWVESTITWNNAPAPSATGLATIGSTATANAWIEVTLPAARFSRNGTYTLEIRSDTPHDGYTWYSSREGANPPELVLSLSQAPPPPVAAFSGSPTAGTAPLTVAFTDASTGERTSWSWDFGDGTSSTAPNPTHTYANPGSYTVSLTVSNAGGRSTATQTNYITVLPSAPVPASS